MNNSNKPHKKKHNPFVYLIVLLFVIIVLVIISFLVHGIRLYSERNFHSNSYTFLVYDGPNDTYLVQVGSFPEKHYSVLHLKGPNRGFSNYPLIRKSVLLKVPVEGELYFNEKSFEDFSESFFSFATVFGYFVGSGENQHKFNQFDLLKTYTTARRASVVNKKYADVSLTSSIEGEGIDKSELNDLFKNEEIINSKTTMEVINMTEIPGLATAFSEMFETAGYNIVSIKSGNTSSSSKINAFEEREEYLSIADLFDLKVEKSKARGIADVVVSIGEVIGQKAIPIENE